MDLWLRGEHCGRSIRTIIASREDVAIAAELTGNACLTQRLLQHLDELYETASPEETGPLPANFVQLVLDGLEPGPITPAGEKGGA